MTIKWANKGNELKSFNKNVCKINATNKMVHIMMYRKYSTFYNDSKSLLCTSKLMSNLIMKLPMYNREHLHIVTFTYIFNIWYQTFEIIFFFWNFANLICSFTILHLLVCFLELCLVGITAIRMCMGHKSPPHGECSELLASKRHKVWLSIKRYTPALPFFALAFFNILSAVGS